MLFHVGFDTTFLNAYLCKAIQTDSYAMNCSNMVPAVLYRQYLHVVQKMTLRYIWTEADPSRHKYLTDLIL